MIYLFGSLLKKLIVISELRKTMMDLFTDLFVLKTMLNYDEQKNTWIDYTSSSYGFLYCLLMASVFFWDAYIEVVKYLGIWESQELWFELGGWRIGSYLHLLPLNTPTMMIVAFNLRVCSNTHWCIKSKSTPFPTRNVWWITVPDIPMKHS